MKQITQNFFFYFSQIFDLSLSFEQNNNQIFLFSPKKMQNSIFLLSFTLIFISFLTITLSQELLLTTQCSLVPYKNEIQIYQTSSSRMGYTYSCQSQECVEIEIPEHYTPTANFFESLEECSSTCNCIYCSLFKIY